MSILQVRDLTIRYRRAGAVSHEAVRGVSFAIEAGEVVGLMGESGCGKSSIALALLGLLDKRNADVSGSILFRSQEVLSMNESQLRTVRGEGMSIIFQEPSLALCPVRRVGDQVAEVIHAHSSSQWKQCRTGAHSMLERVGLKQAERIYKAYPHHLSGGQRQRVALAQALACNRELLIADEPTASLDARSQAGFIQLLKQLNSEQRLSILLISHTPEIQASLADRLLVMKEGKILESGRFEDIREHPSQSYTRMLLARRESVPSKHRSSNSEPLTEQIAR